MKVIRATTPKEYNSDIHTVTKFKRVNYPDYYKLSSDGYYRYQGHSAEASISYSENALLSLSDLTVIEFK